ncbi:MAG TPA: hypothetical protein VHR15_17540 [Ktedonobacterales bacterium]|nr:hypothetical protein [Ktedonobacterales bacterium]
MNALERMWAALRPGGLLLDIRPAPERPWVQVWRGENVTMVGQIDDSYRFGTLKVADAAVQAVVAAGRVARERDVTFTYLYHLYSVDAWLEYMAEHWSSALIPADVIARAREALPPGVEGEVRILRIIRATRLRRV